MLHKMVSFLLSCAIFLMVGCADLQPAPPSIDRLNLTNRYAPLHITVFPLDRIGDAVCARDDSVWFVERVWFGASDYLHKYSAGTGVRLSSVPLNDVETSSCAVTTNSVWVSSIGYLNQIDIATNRIVKVVPLKLWGPLVPAATQNDILWILGRPGLYRIKENETEPVFLSKNREDYTNMVFAADSLWASAVDECRVDRIDPHSGKVLAKISRIPRSFRMPRHRLTYGEGSVWLPCEDFDHPYGAILRIDPNTNEVIAKIPVGGPPRSVAFAMGFAWVSTPGYRESHWLEKINVRTNKVVDRYRLGGIGNLPILVPVTDALWAIGDRVAWHIKMKEGVPRLED